MKYLVTGGTGFLGSAIANDLCAQGHYVQVMDTGRRGKSERLNPQIELFEESILDNECVSDLCQGMDGVIHCAAINGTENFYKYPKEVLEVGVIGSYHVIQGAVLNKCKELFIFSSSEVYGEPVIIPTPESHPLGISDPSNPRFSYAASKIFSEMLSLYSGFDGRLCIVRPFNIYGPDCGNEHVVPQLIEKVLQIKAGNATDLHIQGSGEETRAFCYIEDFIRAFNLVREHANNRDIINIGNAKETTIRSLAETILKELRCTAKIIPGGARAGSPHRRCPDTQKLLSFGWKALFPLEEGIRKTIEKHVVG